MGVDYTPRYRYVQLTLDNTHQGRAHNDRWLGPNTLGIEITSERLAARCGRGNLDHHKRGAIRSAIQMAVEYPLPPEGTILAITRCDGDALCAILTLELRANGLEKELDRFLIDCIGQADLIGFENADSEGYLSRSTNLSQLMMAINTIAHTRDHWPTLHHKLAAIVPIFIGQVGTAELKKIIALRPPKPGSYPVKLYGRVAYVYAPGQYANARSWAGKWSVVTNYDVAVVLDPEYGEGSIRRWTVIRRPNTFDRYGFEAAINTLEAQARIDAEADASSECTWGGLANIISSPDGIGNETLLGDDEIIDLVREYAENGVVS